MLELRWPDLRNARDLGGISTVDGRSIRERALVRTDNHDRLGADGITALRAYGVSRIIDLRWEWEAQKYPSPLANDPIYRLAPASFEPGSDDDIPLDSYRLMVDRSRDLLAAVVCAVAEAPSGAVVVHCHAGRDRTGVVTGLLLAVAGATVEAIGRDYARTPDSPAEMMHRTFAHVHTEYGGVEAYLEGAGVTRAHLAAVRDRLVAQATRA